VAIEIRDAARGAACWKGGGVILTALGADGLTPSMPAWLTKSTVWLDDLDAREDHIERRFEHFTDAVRLENSRTSRRG
jgi:hypothetical protein